MKSLINLRIAFRSIQINKVHSLVSILGLGIGLGSIILISMLYLHELSFDKFIPENKQVFRVLHGSKTSLPFPFGETAKNEIPGIEDFFRYHQISEFEIKQDGQEVISETHFACADSSVFKILGIDFILGKPSESINEVAISESMAMKYFNHGDAINKTLNARINNDFLVFNICGIFKDLPSNSSLNPNFICHTDLIAEFLGKRIKLLGEYKSDNNAFKTNWNNEACNTYIKINKKASHSEINQKLQKYAERIDENREIKEAISLQPITDVYLKSENIQDFYSRRGNKNELKYFIAIAFFILLIAVINYIFLTKAKMDRRYTELGVKKAFGANALSIRSQLLFEANLISFLSLIPAVAVVILGIPFVNSTLGRTLDNQIFSDWYTIPILLIIPLLTGSLSGYFVGTRISRISPMILLNRKMNIRTKKHQWSHSFLSLHFAIFIILLVGTIVLKKQIHYSLNNFTAINPENVLICQLNTPELSKKINVIENQVQQMPGVISTAGSSFIPPFNWTLPIRLGNPETKETIVFDGLIMGKGMTELLNMEMIEGEHFGEFNKDRTDVIFNESAAALYNIKAGEYFGGFYVQGILKDFTAHSMRNPIKPMVIIQQHPEKMGLFAIKTSGETDDQIIAGVTKLFKKLAPDEIVSIQKLEEQIAQFYTRENKQAKLISAFSILAIILSVMGLIGIAMNSVSRRTKEIAIRKVNGAKIFELLIILNMEFVKWIAIAFLVATPFAYFIMNVWLENFAYKTPLSWWIFVLAGFISLLVALVAVSGLTNRAARRNPADSLRYE